MKPKTPKIIEFLKSLIKVPSFSGEELESASLILQFMEDHDMTTKRVLNNIWSTNKYFDPAKPAILLNSHLDTVKPNKAYTKDPFNPVVKDGRLYGLGSNDAGASVVALMAAFAEFYDRKNLKYNLIYSATAEEEISGKNGIEKLLPVLGDIDFAIVGEPTRMKMAIAEKGLLVLDCVVQGKAGHAAHGTGDNAIYHALPDIEWFRTYRFPKVSELLGPVKMNVTLIEAGTQHNVVPGECRFTVDVRVNELYSLQQILQEIREHVRGKVNARSLRLNASSIPADHPVVLAAERLGIQTFGSPTMSDQALIPCPSVKIGPGDTNRSHIADEFVYLTEIEEGIKIYIKLLEQILKS